MSSRSNSNSSKMSMSFGKGKNSMAMLGLCIILVGVCFAYYFMYKSNRESFDGNSSSLTPASGECIVALFYAPWCGHCKTFKPIFDEASSTLDGKISQKPELKGKKVRFTKINCDEEENKPLAKKYDVSGYPTVKIFTDDGGSPIEYEGARTLEGMKKTLVIDN